MRFFAFSSRTVLLALILLAPVASQARDVVVEALLPNGAVLEIDGRRHVVKAGQTVAGVTLLAADAKSATLEINGKRQVLGLSQRVGGHFQAPERREVAIPKDALKQYRIIATINGRRVAVIVDTGANTVAMNTSHARALGVDYEAGLPGKIETAGGMVNAWVVSLDSVDVGGIRVDRVQAAVAEGDFPSTILLGMTFLEHVDLVESNGVLSLSRVW